MKPSRIESYLLMLLAVLAFASGCTSTRIQPGEPTAHVAAAAAPMPTGALGQLVSLGRDILDHTPKYMKRYIRANMSCSACHLQSGTQARGGGLVGVYAQFPQYNERAHRIISLQDRIAECFLYSMNGRPPAYQSKEMEALVAYIAYLSVGTPVGAHQDTSFGNERLTLSSPANAQHGAAIYAQKCSLCHQANGAGVGTQMPALWGSGSFNAGAGMNHLATMAGFVKRNMPLNAPDSLTAQEAYDVSAYVLRQPRPTFNRNRLISFPPAKAGYF